MDAERSRRRALRRRFDRVARGFDKAALLDAEVGARMRERLDYMRLAPARIVDIGAGTGRDLRVLATRYPGSMCIGVDASLGMLRQAQASRGMVSRLLGRGTRAVCADARQLPLAASSVDLVWSNLALHWVDDPLAALQEFARVLRPEGLVMFSAYGPDTLRELAEASSQVPGGSRVRGFPDMHDLGDMLVAAGFSNPVMEAERLTLTYADAKALFADLRTTAQSAGGLPGRATGLAGRARVSALADALDARRREGRLAIGFEISYGHAWKGVQKRTPAGDAIVRTDFARRPKR